MATITEEQNGTEAEFRHAGILQRSVYALKPAPDNDKLYRPILATDPEIKTLAKSIRERGVLEPLVISTDDYIISGHRRLAAARLANLDTVPCRVLPISRFDDHDRFVVLLREHNRQREKSFDEKLREELVSVDPDEAYKALLSERATAAKVAAPALKITGVKTRAAISDAKVPFVNAVLKVLRELRPHWPVSVRQIHYKLLNNPPLKHASKPDSVYQNDKKSYEALVELVARARISGLISWEGICDETRPVTVWKTYRDTATFVRDQLQRFLKGYSRDLMQSQPNHVEIVCEKNTVLSIVESVASNYCIPITSGRGFCSCPPRMEMAKRFRDSGKEKLILLIVSDFDPDGEEIAHSFARSMRDDFGIGRRVHPIKVALTDEQVEFYNLPNAMEAKTSSANAAKFIEKFGTDTYELEALAPEDLQDIVREKINAVIDIDAYNYEVEAEREDAANLKATRQAMLKSINWQEDNS